MAGRPHQDIVSPNKHSGISFLVDFAVPAGPLSASRLPELRRQSSVFYKPPAEDNADNALEANLGRTKRGLTDQ